MADVSGNGHDGLYVGAVAPDVASAVTGDDAKKMHDPASLGGYATIYGYVPDDLAGTLSLTPFPMSWEVWVKFASLPAGGVYQAPMGCRTTDGSLGSTFTEGFNFYRSPGGTFEFWVGKGPLGNSWNILSSSVYPTVGPWYHLVGTISGNTTATQTIYVNGVSAGSLVVANACQNTHGACPMGFGCEMGFSSTSHLPSYPGPVDGSVDEAAVYAGVLSAARVAAHYAARGNAATLPRSAPRRQPARLLAVRRARRPLPHRVARLRPRCLSGVGTDAFPPWRCSASSQQPSTTSYIVASYLAGG